MISSPCVGSIRSTEAQIEQKGGGRADLLSTWAWDMSLLVCFYSYGPRPQAFRFWRELHTRSSGPPAHRLLSLYNCVSRSLMRNIVLCIYSYPIGPFFWKTLNDSDFVIRSGSRNSILQMSFLTGSEISIIGSLIWLDLKMLMTICSSKESSDQLWHELLIARCEISVLATPHQGVKWLYLWYF